MHEIQADGTEHLTARASMRDVKRAIRNPNNLTVAIHKPGSFFETHDGGRRRFKVLEDGTLQRVTTDGTNRPLP